MNRKLIIALVLIAVLAVLFIFNSGRIDVNLLVTDVSILKSLAFLLFTGVGVVIGVLLK